MTFAPLTGVATAETLGALKSDRQRVGIVLTDGAALTGHLYEQSMRSGTLELTVGDQKVLVPLNEIAGVYPAEFEQPSESVDIEIRWSAEQEMSSDPRADEYRSDSVRSALDAAALNCASEHDYEVWTWLHAISGPRPARYGRWKAPRDFQPLYCDWDYFARRAGGLRGIGGGFGVSLSASGHPSLFRDAYREIAGKVGDRSRICGETSALIEGFVSLASSVQVAGVERTTLSMEGASWQAAFVHGGSLVGEDLELSESWAIAYFATHRYAIPLDLWTYSGQSIRVFGDVIPVAADTDLGPVTCFIKARAAACLRSK